MQETQLISSSVSSEFKLLISLCNSFKFEAAQSAYYHTPNCFSLSFLSKGFLVQSFILILWCMLAYLHVRVTKVSVN